MSASDTIPYVFRFPLLYLEPIFAFSGAILVFSNPQQYASTMTRGLIKTVDSSSDFIYTELGGGWLHFAFTEAIVLRFVDDVRLWQLICVGMLLSDMAYCYSCAQAVGGWAEWLVISNWTVEDWTVTITTWPFVLARLAIALGIGNRKGSTQVGKERKR